MATTESIYMELDMELGEYKSTSPFHSTSFKPVMNHSVTYFEKGKMLSSYGVNVAVIFNDGKIILDPKHDYSPTTNKYVGQFTGLNLKARNKEIESGTIKIKLLNLIK
jgi:hypothetical protein